MVEMLNMHWATFFRKIQNLTPFDPKNRGKCEFCLREKEKDDDDNITPTPMPSPLPLPLPSPSRSVITYDMIEHLKTACNGHNYADIARLLGIKPNTFRRYITNKDIKFTNKDETKCYFCELVNNTYWTIRRSMQQTFDLIKKLAFQEKKTNVGMICKIAATMLYHSNRKASQWFQKIEEDPEQFESSLKFDISKKQAIQMKIKMKLSVSQYDIMRDFLCEYLNIPSYSTIANEIKQLMPIEENPHDFIMNGKIVGKYWPIPNVVQNTVLDILERHHGEDPNRVEEELFIKGGFEGDGFSGCTDRVGKDIDLNTASRYFVGMKISRIVGKRRLDSSISGPKEFFVETSQSFVTVKPILIGEFKENNESLQYVWKWVEEHWEHLKTFTIQFHSREIKVHFENPKLIGDGKCFLQLLNVPCAYCYLCNITCEEAQEYIPLDSRLSAVFKACGQTWKD